MRVVGRLNRSSFVLDPAEAFRRARELDAQLATARPPYPRGLFRGTPSALAAEDERRMRSAAAHVERGATGPSRKS
jgi:hypothetical protein